MSAHLTEEEQVEAFKRWWKENGTMTLGAVVLATAGYFGFGAYQASQAKAEQTQSALYDTLITSSDVVDQAEATDAQKAAVISAAEAVVDENDKGLYSDLARFKLAKLSVESGELEQAAEALSAIVDNSPLPASVELATLRLARVKAAMGNVDGAIADLSVKSSNAFVASYAEAKGDILKHAGRMDEASTAYEKALEAAESGEGGAGMQTNILRFKLDNTRLADATVLAENAVESAAGVVEKTGEATE